MRTIAISNHKGGSGKTTTAVNLAAALAERGPRVLLVDLDPQCSASWWCATDGAQPGAYEVLFQGCSLFEAARPTEVPGVQMIAGSRQLVHAEHELASEPDPQLRLRRAIGQTLNGEPRWDYVLIDCPPSLGILTTNAFIAATHAVIPVEAHVLALEGLVQLMETLTAIRQRHNPDLDIAAIVPCRVDNRTRHSQDIVASLRSSFGDLVATHPIRENVRIAEAPSFRKAVTTYAGTSTGAVDYRGLAEEILTRTDGPRQTQGVQGVTP